ncbi:MAG TPA: hypothetical protein VHG08_12185 [Longimicrobium sp.]|nr:hypothetical protein [Longimicrobium sp.]
MRASTFGQLVLLLALLASGCMRWHSTPLPSPREQGDSVLLGTLRVTARPGTELVPSRERMVLRDVRVHGDSLIGWGGTRLDSNHRIAVHRDQILGLEYGRIDWRRTGNVAGAVVLTVVAVYGAVVYYVLTTMGV